ncbi:MAG: hypothetical protein WBC63_01235 [Candidatus Bipolaricaulia bacterium]
MIEETTRELPAFELLVEDAGGQGCLGHVPALPGLCFRAETVADVESLAPVRIREYADWLAGNGLGDLTPEVAQLASRGRAASSLRIVVAEHVAGAPVWESGNAAVLFERDLHLLGDDGVTAHLRFTRRALDEMREIVERLPDEKRAWKQDLGRRSVDETLEHVGNCVWWYCSRIDDAFPEPEEPSGESPWDRIDRLFEIAEHYLQSVPFAERSRIHVPTRFLTKDPHERWTHAKVCRRQAEHVWAHLPGLRSAVESVRRC